MAMANELLPLHHYKNIIIDLDGTLIDSNDARAHAFIDAFEAHDIHTITFNDIRKLIGMGGKGILCRVLDEQTFTEKWEELTQERHRIFQERYMEHVPLIPGAIPLLELLQAHGLRIAISTSSHKPIVDYFVKKFNLTPLIEGFTSSEDSTEGKPHPMAIEACCEKFGFVPSETIMIGDSPYDVVAAHEYSIDTVCVLTGGYERTELMKTGALAVYQDLNDIYQTFQQTVLSQ